MDGEIELQELELEDNVALKAFGLSVCLLYRDKLRAFIMS